jgi:hypothetical protein
VSASPAWCLALGPRAPTGLTVTATPGPGREPPGVTVTDGHGWGAVSESRDLGPPFWAFQPTAGRPGEPTSAGCGRRAFGWLPNGRRSAAGRWHSNAELESRSSCLDSEGGERGDLAPRRDTGKVRRPAAAAAVRAHSRIDSGRRRTCGRALGGPALASESRRSFPASPLSRDGIRVSDGARAPASGVRVACLASSEGKPAPSRPRPGRFGRALRVFAAMAAS